jgi:hypothetical protein
MTSLDEDEFVFDGEMPPEVEALVLDDVSIAASVDDLSMARQAAEAALAYVALSTAKEAAATTSATSATGADSAVNASNADKVDAEAPSSSSSSSSESSSGSEAVAALDVVTTIATRPGRAVADDDEEVADGFGAWPFCEVDRSLQDDVIVGPLRTVHEGDLPVMPTETKNLAGWLDSLLRCPLK